MVIRVLFGRALRGNSMSYLPQTVRLILWTLFGGFFLLFGIHVLIGAYRLKDPFSFVLTFFASNLIILISGVVLVGVFFKVWNGHRKQGPEPEDPHSEKRE